MRAEFEFGLADVAVEVTALCLNFWKIYVSSRPMMR